MAMQMKWNQKKTKKKKKKDRAQCTMQMQMETQCPTSFSRKIKNCIAPSARTTRPRKHRWWKANPQNHAKLQYWRTQTQKENFPLLTCRKSQCSWLKNFAKQGRLINSANTRSKWWKAAALCCNTQLEKVNKERRRDGQEMKMYR